jgi:hypothetical protein
MLLIKNPFILSDKAAARILLVRAGTTGWNTEDNNYTNRPSKLKLVRVKNQSASYDIPTRLLKATPGFHSDFSNRKSRDDFKSRRPHFHRKPLNDVINSSFVM